MPRLRRAEQNTEVRSVGYRRPDLDPLLALAIVVENYARFHPKRVEAAKRWWLRQPTPPPKGE